VWRLADVGLQELGVDPVDPRVLERALIVAGDQGVRPT